MSADRNAVSRGFPPPGGTRGTSEADTGVRVRIRSLTSLEDCNACVALQREVWGDISDIVPAALLHVVDFVGGIAAGAFDADGTMLGFVFGMSGIHDGELAHWSHMLGVRDSARNHGVGRLLKEYQRRMLGEIGVRRIFWTFDPLMSKNAYFNLNRLGAVVVEYVPDMYGATASPLHLGLPTDRLIVCLTTVVQPTAVPLAVGDDLPVMTPFPQPGDRTLAAGDDRPATVLVEMPADILDEVTRAPARAATWRLALRERFQWALSQAYTPRAVHRNATAGRFFYVMQRGV